jgi:hypothetical protein
MFRILGTVDQLVANSWVCVQAKQFSYAVQVFDTAGRIKIFFGDFFATEVDLNFYA